MGGLIIGSNGGALVGPGGGGFTFDVVAPEVGILDRTLTVHNQSGSAVASGKQWYFGHGFVQGEVASGQKVVLKSSAVELPTYQYGSVETWPDGSLRTAAFKVELPASINHLASLDLDLSAETGAPDNTSTIINADVTTNSDLSIEVVESGTTYLSDFNDLIASAELVEVGPACKTWRAVERLHTSAPVAHDRLFALWYLTWFNNDT